MGVEFTFTGFDAVLRRLQQFDGDVVDAADEAVAEASQEAADLVRAAAPEDTGRLRASVTHTHHGWGIASVQVGGAAATHARPVEARLKFFNRSISVVQVGLLDRVADKIIEAAF